MLEDMCSMCYFDLKQSSTKPQNKEEKKTLVVWAGG